MMAPLQKLWLRRGLLRAYLTRLVHFFFYRATIVVYRSPHQTPKSPDSLVRIERLHEGHLARLSPAFGPEACARFAGLLAQGEQGYIAYCGDEPAHISWLKLGPSRGYLWYQHLWEELDPNMGLIHDCETLPKWRGQDIYPAVLACIASTNEVHNLLIATSDQNLASQRGIEKAGYVPFQKRAIFKFLGLTFRTIMELTPAQ